VSGTPLIDACVHHRWSNQAEIMEYMSRGWNEFLGEPDSLPGGGGAIPILPGFPYKRPEGDRLVEAAIEGSPAGSSYEVLKDQVLDAFGVERAVLSYDEAMLTPATPNTHLAREVARAANDWTIDRWLSRDERLASLILVPNQVGADAVAEIERVGGNRQMVGVLMSANGLGKPFGHPGYHEIYAAAAEQGLPIVIHSGGDAIAETLTSPTAGGLPATYAEYYVFQTQPLMTHLISLVGQGVFEKFPSLKVMFVGAGVSWLPSVVWRFDTEYMAYRREAPWVRRMPSEYVQDHIRLATYPLDSPAEPERLVRLLRAFPGIDDLLVYGSGYPSWDTDWHETVEERLPPEWHQKIFHDNAQAFFRWGDSSTEGAPATETVGDMDAPRDLAHIE
jgi:predicted TIM-barrel fold metal-dependent hydrolase